MTPGIKVAKGYPQTANPDRRVFLFQWEESKISMWLGRAEEALSKDGSFPMNYK